MKPIIKVEFYWAKSLGYQLIPVDTFRRFKTREEAYKCLEEWFSRGDFIYENLVLVESACCENPRVAKILGKLKRQLMVDFI